MLAEEFCAPLLLATVIVSTTVYASVECSMLFLPRGENSCGVNGEHRESLFQ